MNWVWVNFPNIYMPWEISNLNDYLEIIDRTVWELNNESKITYDQIRQDPYLLKDMDKLVDRMILAYNRGENVVVFWDYDVDGVSGTAVMERWLSYLWFQNVKHIAPTRDTWYSIQRDYIYDYIESHSEADFPSLIITVDCGIKSWTEIDFISKELWIDVIVTDHHLPGSSLSQYGIAHVDPHREDSEYPFRPMSWSFVALKVIEALREVLPFVSWPRDARNPNWNPNAAMNELQEIAVLWVVADMMPIVGENKILVREALPRYIFSKNLAIQTFTKNLVNADYMKSPKDIKPTLIWFGIGPRINAAKRIWDSTIPLDMLLSENQEDVTGWYGILNDMNEERKDLVRDEKLIAIEYAENIVLNWARGVCYVKPEVGDWIIWLIAWQIKEHVYLPSIVIGWYKEEKGILKWSCRSIEWVHMLDMLDSLSWYLLGYGWHAMAAGFSVKEENLDAFVSAVYEYFANNVPDECLNKKRSTFWYIRNYSIISQWFLNVIELSAPFWMANPEPTFVVLWRIKYVNYMWDKKQHIKLTLENSNWENVTWICWKYDTKFIDLLSELWNNPVWQKVWLVWTIWLNEYNWNVTKQIQFDDIIFM